MQYYIKRGDQVQGPLGHKQLMSLARQKKLKKSDLIGNSKDGSFQTIDTVWDLIKTKTPISNEFEPNKNMPSAYPPKNEKLKNKPESFSTLNHDKGFFPWEPFFKKRYKNISNWFESLNAEQQLWTKIGIAIFGFLLIAIFQNRVNTQPSIQQENASIQKKLPYRIKWRNNYPFKRSANIYLSERVTKGAALAILHEVQSVSKRPFENEFFHFFIDGEDSELAWAVFNNPSYEKNASLEIIGVTKDEADIFLANTEEGQVAKWICDRVLKKLLFVNGQFEMHEAFIKLEDAPMAAVYVVKHGLKISDDGSAIQPMSYDPQHDRFSLNQGLNEWYKITSEGFLQLGDDNGIFTSHKPYFFDKQKFENHLKRIVNKNGS
jgi:hypothetical protein